MQPQPIIRPVEADDLAAIGALHRLAFGPGRYARTAYRVREGSGLSTPHCRAAFLGNDLVAALRFTEIRIADAPGTLLLGPVAIHPSVAGKGFGRTLIAQSIDDARASGFRMILLVGDLAYYGRFGFVRVTPGQITLPGPVDPARLLALELQPGVLAGYRGGVTSVRS